MKKPKSKDSNEENRVKKTLKEEEMPHPQKRMSQPQIDKRLKFCLFLEKFLKSEI